MLVCFRFYGLTDAIPNKTWRLGEFEEVAAQ